MTPGDAIEIVYLPEAPAFSRPGAPRDASAKAASNRRTGWKIAGGIFYFFGFFLVMNEWRLRRMRRTGQTEHTDREGYRARLALTGVFLLLPMVVLISGWHAMDASGRGDSIAPVVLGLVLAMAVVGGTAFYFLRGGHEKTKERSLRALKWAVPLLIGITTLRVVALWLRGRL